MRVKRYVAVNMQEAMGKIKAELGNNAVILHTRYFKEGGFFGLFGKNYVEVTAAADNDGEDVSANNLAAIKQKINNVNINNDKEIVTDLTEMHKMMKEMSLMLENLGEPKFPKKGQNLYKLLKKQEVDDKIAQKIVKLTLDEYADSPIQKKELNRIFLLTS